MFFWGPIFGPGVIKKKGWLLRNRHLNFSFIDLEPDGCLVADQLRIRTDNLWNHGRRQRKGADPVTGWCPGKINALFCDGEVFFVDRGLLMGASITTYWKYCISNAYHIVFKNTGEGVKSQPCFIVDLMGILIPYYWMDKRWVLRLAFLFFSPSFFLKFFLWSSIVLSCVDILRVSGLRLKLWYALKLTPNLTEFRLHISK